MSSGKMPLRSRSAAILLPALMLTGCALMGGGGKPDTLYTFGGSAMPAQSGPAPVHLVTVIYGGATLSTQSSGSRILTESGNQVAYIAASRWVAPASDLFDAAAIRKLESVPSIRIIQPGARPQADYLLSITIGRFSAVYSGGADAPPDAVIETRAKLIRVADRTIVCDWTVEERVPALQNRVSAIVAALDQSIDAATTRIADLTRQATAGENDRQSADRQ